MARIFLSYASQGEGQVIRLETELERAGHPVWRDRTRILAGDPYPEKINEGFENAEVVIVCLSEAALESPWVKLELHVALVLEREVSAIISGTVSGSRSATSRGRRTGAP